MHIKKTVLTTMIFCSPLWTTPVTLADKKTIAEIFASLGYQPFQKHTKFAKQVAMQSHDTQSLLTALHEAIEKCMQAHGAQLCDIPERQKPHIIARILESTDQALSLQQIQELHEGLENELAPQDIAHNSTAQQEEYVQNTEQNT